MAKCLHSPARDNDRIERARAFAEDRYRRRVTVAEMASLACLERKYFSRVFKEQVGASPKQYVTALRMRAAARLLEVGGLAIGRVAEEVGYGDQFLFSRAFRRYAGLSPSEFRRSRVSDPETDNRCRGASG